MEEKETVKKGMRDIVTGVPFITGLILIFTILFYFMVIKTHENYIVNSTILTKGSYVKINQKGELVYSINANLFPVLDKEDIVTNKVSEIELQKALLRKENKLLSSFKENPEEPQVNFDLAMWYLFTAGVKTELTQMQQGRQNRLLASYYYLKRFNNLMPSHKPMQMLEINIKEYLDERIKGNRQFYVSLTEELAKNLNQPLSPEEQQNENMLEAIQTAENVYPELKNLCKYLETKIESNKRSEKLAYIEASLQCYRELTALQDSTEKDSLQKQLLETEYKEFVFK
jgi:hypothetical protein